MFLRNLFAIFLNFLLENIELIIKNLKKLQKDFLKTRCKKVKAFKNKKQNIFGFNLKKSKDELILKIGYYYLNIHRKNLKKYNQDMNIRERRDQKLILQFKNSSPSFYITYRNAITNEIDKVVRISDHKLKSTLPWFHKQQTKTIIYDKEFFIKKEKKGELTWDSILKGTTYPEF